MKHARLPTIERDRTLPRSPLPSPWPRSRRHEALCQLLPESLQSFQNDLPLSIPALDQGQQDAKEGLSRCPEQHAQPSLQLSVPGILRRDRKVARQNQEEPVKISYPCCLLSIDLAAADQIDSVQVDKVRIVSRSLFPRPAIAPIKGVLVPFRSRTGVSDPSGS